MSVSVLLADDQPVVRAGLRAWFEGTAVHVVGEAPDGEKALRLVEQLQPQVLVIEAAMAHADGLQCLARLRETESDVASVIYTGHENPTYAARASALGATGYVSKAADRETLLEAITAAAEGRPYWPTNLVRRLTGSLATPTADGNAALRLTTREQEVLKQLAFGLSNKEIAQALGISYETVKEHVQHILRKLGVADRTQAAVWAVRRGLA